MTIEIIVLFQEKSLLDKFQSWPVSKMIGKTVIEERTYSVSQDRYSVCPTCHCGFERSYQRYCDRCGQRLRWRINAKVIKLKKHSGGEDNTYALMIPIASTHKK